MIDFYSTIGWLGMILILLAYLLLAAKKLKFNSIIYHLLNLLGGVGIVTNTFITKSWPAMTLNILWAGIAVFSIIKIVSKKK